MPPSTIIHPIMRPLVLASFKAYCHCFNAARCCVDLRELAGRDFSLPSGVTLPHAVAARHAQSVYETAALMAFDGIDVQLDAVSAANIQTMWGNSFARLAVGLAESAGAPDRHTLAVACAAMKAALVPSTTSTLAIGAPK